MAIVAGDKRIRRCTWAVGRGKGKGWQSGIKWGKGTKWKGADSGAGGGGKCYTCLRAPAVWAPRRRGEISQMVPGEISRGINWDNGASDRRGDSRRNRFRASALSPRTNISLFAKMSRDQPRCIFSGMNSILMKDTDGSRDATADAKCTPPRASSRLIGTEEKWETRSIRLHGCWLISRFDDCSIIFDSFFFVLSWYTVEISCTDYLLFSFPFLLLFTFLAEISENFINNAYTCRNIKYVQIMIFLHFYNMM